MSSRISLRCIQATINLSAPLNVARMKSGKHEQREFLQKPCLIFIEIYVNSILK
jgi:hypothetical protein